METARVIPLLPVTALAHGEMTACRVDGEEVLVANVDGQYFALPNFCSHAGARLSTGRLKGYELSCPLHRAKFDIRSGAVIGGPAVEPLRRYPVVTEGGKLYLLGGLR